MAMRSAFRSRAYFNPEHRRPSWWLRFASYRAESENEPLTLNELERIRRSQLTAWALLGLFFAILAFAPVVVIDMYSAMGATCIELAVIVGILLNRKGKVNVAGYLVVTLTILGTIIGPIGYGLSQGGLSVDLLPVFDYLAAAVLLAATTLPPRSAFIVLSINIIIMLLCWNFLPHSSDLLLDQTAYPSQLIAAGTLIGRPIGWNILCAFLGFYIVQGYSQANLRMYVAMSVVEDRTDLATAMARTAEEQTMIQHYQDLFFTAITQYVANRSQGIVQSIQLKFPHAQTAIEEQTQIRVATEARRLNVFFRRLDTQEEQRIWGIRQYIAALRHYCQALVTIVQDPGRADISTIHPRVFGTTNDPTVDSLISLVFATVVSAEPAHLLTRSKLSFSDVGQFTEQVRSAAITIYQNANRIYSARTATPAQPQASPPTPGAGIHSANGTQSPLRTRNHPSGPTNSSGPSDLPFRQTSPRLDEGYREGYGQGYGQSYEEPGSYRGNQPSGQLLNSDYPTPPYQPYRPAAKPQSSEPNEFERGNLQHRIGDDRLWPSLEEEHYPNAPD